MWPCTTPSAKSPRGAVPFQAVLQFLRSGRTTVPHQIYGPALRGGHNAPDRRPTNKMEHCAGRVNEVARFVVAWCPDGTPEEPIQLVEPRALALAVRPEGLSYRLIGRNVGLSKNTVMEIVRSAQ